MSVLGLADSIAQQHLKRVRIKSEFISAVCPFHKGGTESHPSFWVNRQTGHWGCFTCGAHGGGLKWLLKDLGVGTAGFTERLEEAEKQAKKNSALEKSRIRKKNKKSFAGEHTLPDALLGVFDFLPLDLVDAGFDKKTLKEYNVGYDRRNNRITYPIRDVFGDLVGISGRATLIGDEPKYLVYNGRKIIDGKEVMGELGEWYPEYSNENVRDHLWGMDKRYNTLLSDEIGDDYLIVVEGYKAALWLVQNGWVNTVALMGSGMSPCQERIIRKLGVPVFVLLDNNLPGREGSRKICQRLAVSTFPVYEVRYDRDCESSTQPDDLDEKEIEKALNKATRVGGRRHARTRKERSTVRFMGRRS